MDADWAYKKTTYTLTNVVPGDVLAPFWSTPDEPLRAERLTVVDGTSCTTERPDVCDSYDGNMTQRLRTAATIVSARIIVSPRSRTEPAVRSRSPTSRPMSRDASRQYSMRDA